jgi:hypothetical protein
VLAAAGFTAVAHLPVFSDGAALAEWKRTRKIDVTPRALLFGAILHAGEDAPGVDTGPFRERLPALLGVLAKWFKEASVEALVTNAAAVLRESHGSSVSQRALRNLLGAIPSLHQARSDLIFDIWIAALRTQRLKLREALEPLLEEFEKLDRTRLDPGPRAMVCYAAVAATSVIAGMDAARCLFSTVGTEIDAGDEGELRKNLEAFLAGEGREWSVLEVTME